MQIINIDMRTIDQKDIEQIINPNITDREIQESKIFLRENFGDQLWVEPFIKDTHHGILHGLEVINRAIHLLMNLNEEEDKLFDLETQLVGNIPTTLYIIQYASLLHDCGRFNDEGRFVAEEQRIHPERSFERAKKLISSEQGLKYLEDAILCHDFKSEESTPFYQSPESIIGKLVQAADQLDWFNPNVIERTFGYGKTINRPFFNDNISFETRLNIIKNIGYGEDTLTFLFYHLNGPTSSERIGIEYAQKLIPELKKLYRVRMLEIAEENNVQELVQQLLIESEKKIEVTTS